MNAVFFELLDTRIRHKLNKTMGELMFKVKERLKTDKQSVT